MFKNSATHFPPYGATTSFLQIRTRATQPRLHQLHRHLLRRRSAPATQLLLRQLRRHLLYDCSVPSSANGSAQKSNFHRQSHPQLRNRRTTQFFLAQTKEHNDNKD
ncbi:hypothetical protein AAZX31_17G019500 [Glycine max]|nr:hypothetical protein JHK86_046237 [Glycine max]KAG4942133.1 hypothetical protein JHK85_046779 [Glycine max]KHN03417.1 hypothetical protein glysoja_004443 [Glycine soja]